MHKFIALITIIAGILAGISYIVMLAWVILFYIHEIVRKD